MNSEHPYGEGSLSICLTLLPPGWLVPCSLLSGTSRTEATLSRAARRNAMLLDCPTSPELPTAGNLYKAEIRSSPIYNVIWSLCF